jgi:DNA-binding NtrC family response regulator
MTTHDEATTSLLKAATAPGPINSPEVTVEVISGPDAGMRVTINDLAHRRVLLGKTEACELRLKDETVSRRHASLELDDRGIRIQDLQSSNGTVVNGVLVDDAHLRGDETVKLGTTELRITRGDGRRNVEASNEASFGKFVGASPAVRRLYPTFATLADSDEPLLIEGEPGTGKELLAEVIHEAGPRKSGPFMVFDCEAWAPARSEALLFGHDGPNAPEGTGGPGILEQAKGGTVLFDEIGDLHPPLQIKLLRALEKKSLRRIGGADPIPIDVRAIVSTRRELERDVQARRFREELLDFVSKLRVELPPLRRRKGDVTLLAQFFWTRLGGELSALPSALLERFGEHTWPGNVRELQDAVAQQFASADAGITFSPSMPTEPSLDFLDAVVREGLPFARARRKVTLEFDRRFLSHVMEVHGGNVSRASAASGISRRYFYMIKAKQ